ncbi:[Fe-Fe] hydrogenase large subunit C-terminal domain-containing protein [Clostridium sp. C2-6-12]|uniref:[Fe-Fe] hydrogenase large subunit C-terminal domain-containing protein n=1 Tax=Clostridium sp. C2-6-12 TaxID=2698832 RepID=UPI00136E9709|nr:[Fe-Fe] hydrogenase large subunit C-terminal domain-containing protein [Clostridium sp. C2-6-12]
MYNFEEQIYLNEEKCTGCNKCLTNCPVAGANIAYLVEGKNKIRINSEKCIHCGKCIKVCDHNARDFRDDTERFFNDLSNGKKLSVVAAPSLIVNFKEYKKLLGFLKKSGVNFIYDVSFGADITIWAYLKTIGKNKLDTIIAQPCPSIVTYIQKYQPELLDKLAPIQSPMICTAIYMKKYKKIEDEIAFLSPCIAKGDEINDKNTYGYVKYNVTFKKLTEYLQKNKIHISEFEEIDFDYIDCGLGFLFSRPGGLKENIEARLKDAWIRQINGPHHAYSYLEAYNKNIKMNRQMPLVVDILNCTYGCNFGTGTCNKYEDSMNIDEAEYKFQKLKNIKNTHSDKFDLEYNYFDENLNLEDFKRLYSKDDVIIDIIEPTYNEYDEIFRKMNKLTEESRNINCSACGYGSCKTMAKCIHNGLNILSNCIDYNKKEVINEHHLLEERNEFFTNISHELRTPLNVIYSVLQMEMNYYNNLTAENIEKYNKIIKQNCLRLIKLVNNIIDISRIDAGFFKPLYKVENIVNVIENITMSIATYVKNKKMSLVFDTEIEELYCNCDSNLIERIILNLLSNAVKYGRENGTITVLIYKNDFNVVISVKDNGIGIPEEMQKKIFERFQKVDTSLSRQSEGSGIGLSLVKSLVEIQGGTVICNSKINEGTEFLVMLPLIIEEDGLLSDINKHVLYEKDRNEIVKIEFSDVY